MPPPAPSAARVSLFYSYSHKDEALREELETHLSLLRRQGVINGWHDRRIAAGTEWVGQIDQHLEAADVVLLLVSADFLASDYCYDVEMKRALERHAAGTARVIPVILRPVDDWQSAPFGKLQALPKDGKPVTDWRPQDKAFADIARGIREAVASLATGVQNPPTPAQSAPVVTPPAARVRALDRATLVRTLSGLSPSDMALLVALVEGAAAHVSRHGTIPEQAAELIRWAESSTGPGLRAVDEAREHVSKPFDGPSPSPGTPTVGRSSWNVPDPPPQGGVWNIPPHNIHFAGREDTLELIRRALVDADRVALCGMPGMGKTRTAIEFVKNSRFNRTYIY
jgi:hypothetical protein